MSTAIDYDRMDALEAVRQQDSQMPSPAQFHVPRAADNYNAPKVADNYPAGGNNHADRLSAARQQSLKENTALSSMTTPAKGIKNGNNGILTSEKHIKDLTAAATPMGALSLAKQINFLADMPFIAALGAALLKDLIDFVAAETIILSIVFSILCSIFIFMMLLLAGSNGEKKGATNLLKMVGIIAGGGIADSIPGLDFFPIETLTVAAVYFLTLIDRKNAKQ